MKSVFLGLVVFATQFNFAQDSFTGPMGIGTSAPLAKLDIRYGNILVKNFSNTNNNSAIMIAHSIVEGDYTTLGTSIGTVVQSAGANSYGMQFFTQESHLYGQTEKVRIQGNGNVGIGTTDPLYKLDVKGGGHFLVPDDKSGVGGLTIETINGTNLKIGGNSTYSWIQSHAALPLYINELGNNTIVNPVYGNVGIGTLNPDEKLTVKGKIHTQEVRVDMTGPLVPDYVFANDYKLKTLKEVEEYIKVNNHLPEIPSAVEIEKNGLMLAEMNMNLLKKIEELTLYAIEQEKKSDKLMQLIEAQTNLISVQTKRIEKLEEK